ncbi:MAG: hypothetical protein LIP05_12660 [Tannerellaceae bacterium]|nr:hypothetical protein [Tannerellaceae bacterium]
MSLLKQACVIKLPLNVKIMQILLVRGLKQEAFDFYVLAARRQRATFQVILCETPNGEHAILELDPDQLKKDYFDYGDTFL